MGVYEDVMNKVAPDGKMPASFMDAINSLLTGGQTAAGPQGGQPAQTAQPSQGTAQPGGGGMFGGLSDLLAKLQASGDSKAVDSWVANGANAPIAPERLETALGQQTVASLARQAGVSEEVLLAKLSTVLPGLVDKLTPNGNVPTPEQIAAYLARR